MNNIKLQEGHPLDKHLRPIKVEDEVTPIEISKDKVRVKDLEVMGSTEGISATDGTKLPLSGGTMSGNVDFGDNDITNVDSLDADKFSIAGGTEMTSIAGSAVSDNSNAVIPSNRTVKTYVDSLGGQIIGYTYLQPTDTHVTHEIQNSLTVESTTHKITFNTPPSEKVEIELSCFINVSSTDTNIDVGLSDSNIYNSIGQQFEYDFSGVYFTDDEVDDDMLTVKWVLESSQLATVGASNTFFVGFSTAGVTKTAYLSYGLRSTHSVSHPPFILKATSLPSSIYTG